MGEHVWSDIQSSQKCQQVVSKPVDEISRSLPPLTAVPHPTFLLIVLQWLSILPKVSSLPSSPATSLHTKSSNLAFR